MLACSRTSRRTLLLAAPFLFALVAVHAQTPNEMALPVNAGLVSTTATAHRRLPKTVADVAVGIQTQGVSADAVARDLAARSQTLLAWLREQGTERLATDQVSFQPQNHVDKNGQEKIVGYTGSTSVRFRTTPAKVGAMLSGVLEHGANSIQNTSYAPSEDEQEKARRELAQEATRTAVAEGEAVAMAAGTHVIGVRQVNVEPSGMVRPMPMMARAMDSLAAAPAPPVATEAGDQEVSVNVSVQLTVSR